MDAAPARRAVSGVIVDYGGVTLYNCAVGLASRHVAISGRIARPQACCSPPVAILVRGDHLEEDTGRHAGIPH